MFNPLLPFKEMFIDAMIQKNQRYIVSQTFNQAYDHFADPEKVYLLFTEYQDIGKAQVHLSALQQDQYAALLYLQKEAHQKKIKEMIVPESKYIIYSSVVKSNKEVDKRLKIKYANNLRRFIAKHTSWKIGADKGIVPKFELYHGDFYVILQYSGYQDLRVPLSEIEKA